MLKDAIVSLYNTISVAAPIKLIALSTSGGVWRSGVKATVTMLESMENIQLNQLNTN